MKIMYKEVLRLEMLDLVSLKNKLIQNNENFFTSLDRKLQKKLGQFTTPDNLAKYMADRLIENADLKKGGKIRILDPGAGSGVLSIAVLEKLFTLNKDYNIQLDAYEIDDKAFEILKSNLILIKKWADKNNLRFKFEIRHKDYIINSNNLFDKGIYENEYDLIISNPPYKKLSSRSEESERFPFIVYGSPNEYGFFLTKSVLELKENGTCIYITPRSWFSGVYFKKLRNFVLSYSSIVEIHSFTNRNNVFGKTKVLQELVIFVIKKTKANDIKYYSHDSLSNINNSDNCFSIKKRDAIKGSEKRILIMNNQNDVEVLELSNKLKSTFIDSGLRMRTGLTVSFRNLEKIKGEEGIGRVPIFYPSNFYGFEIVLNNKESKYIETDKKGLLQNNQDYIFVKRFSSKEQKRRIQVAYYKASDFNKFDQISTDNKIDFVVCKNRKVLKGAFIMLSSTFFDRYYRLLSGNTQVNSLEINSMNFPTVDELIKLGNTFLLNELHNMSQENIDLIVEEYMEGLSNE